MKHEGQKASVHHRLSNTTAAPNITMAALNTPADAATPTLALAPTPSGHADLQHHSCCSPHHGCPQHPSQCGHNDLGPSPHPSGSGSDPTRGEESRRACSVVYHVKLRSPRPRASCVAPHLCRMARNSAHCQVCCRCFD
jgi:hypothetical protein